MACELLTICDEFMLNASMHALKTVGTSDPHGTWPETPWWTSLSEALPEKNAINIATGYRLQLSQSNNLAGAAGPKPR